VTADDLDETLRALAHPARRTFVQLCRSDRRSAGDLAETTDLSLATVSEHLKVLRKTGLLTLRIEGRFWFYRTDHGKVAATLAALREAVDGT
jgi:DNA-binding transcriptional ArsR family regulator